MLSCQEHRYLSSHHILALSTLTIDSSRGDIEVMTHFLYNIVNGEWMIIHLDSTFNDTFCQSDINITIIYDAICLLYTSDAADEQ